MLEQTYLERTLYRLRAQYATLAVAVDRLGLKSGIVWEIGLGKGRSYDHLRRLLPEADIFAFDRECTAVADCTPPDDRLILGELTETLPRLAAMQNSAVTLVHIDLGTKPVGEATRRALEHALAEALAPGGLVASGAQISLSGMQPVVLPAPSAAGGYTLSTMIS